MSCAACAAAAANGYSRSYRRAAALVGRRAALVVDGAELCAELGAERCVILPPGGDLDGKLPMRLERFVREVMEPLS